MPNYEYCCTNERCECNTFETLQSYKDEALIICPFCGEESIHRVMSLMHIGIKNSNTLGSLADKNRKAMGKYGYEEKIREIQEKRLSANEFVGKLPAGAKQRKREAMNTPWRKSTEPVDLSLANMNNQQKEKYIITGKK